MLIEMQSIGSKEQRTRDGPPMQYYTITSSMPTGMASPNLPEKCFLYTFPPLLFGLLHVMAVFMPLQSYVFPLELSCPQDTSSQELKGMLFARLREKSK
jgi:hypothetical protein